MDTDELYWDRTPFLAIDTETTGFSRNDRICEIAIVARRGTEILETFHSRVNPGCSISEGARAVHGLSDEDVADAPTFEQIRPKILDLLIRDMPWVAHQMNFDARMLSYDIPREEWPRGVFTLCTMEYAKKHHPILKLHGHHRLLDVAGALGINYDPDTAHAALADALMLSEIVPRMMHGRLVHMHYTRMSENWLK